MDQDIRTFLNQIALKMHKSTSEIAPYISKFRENWIDNCEQLLNISNKEWDDLEIPLGLKH